MPVPNHKFKGKYRIESNRMKGWDYGSPGYYFITICTKDRIPWFGQVKGDQIIFTKIGKIAVEYLEKIPEIRVRVNLDAWVVMPNHVHAIIVIDEGPMTVEIPWWGISTKSNWKTGALGTMVNQYKAACTRRIHQVIDENFAWQSGYYDHIVRNENSLEAIRLYIISNPTKWAEDEYYRNM